MEENGEKKFRFLEASLVAQMVNSVCNAGDQVWSLIWEDTLKLGMSTHSSIINK